MTALRVSSKDPLLEKPEEALQQGSLGANSSDMQSAELKEIYPDVTLY